MEVVDLSAISLENSDIEERGRRADGSFEKMPERRRGKLKRRNDGRVTKEERKGASWSERETETVLAKRNLHCSREGLLSRDGEPNQN